MLKRIKDNKRLLKEFTTIFSSKKKVLNKDLKYKTILFCPINSSQLNTYKEALIGEFCSLKGSKPSFLFQTSTPPFLWKNKKAIINLNYKLKVFYNIKFIKKLGFNVITTKRKKKVDNVDTELYKQLNSLNFHQFVYKDILIGDLILADTIRYFLSPGPLWDSKDFNRLLKKTFFFALKLVNEYTEVLEFTKPSKLVMSHGIYLYWGILFRLAQKQNIPVNVYGASYRKNTLRFYLNNTNAPMPMYEWDNKFKNIALTKKEKNYVYEYLKSRKTQSKDNISLFNTSKETNKDLENFISTSKSQNKKICILYTNMSWDAYAFSGSSIFKSMEEWIIKTIEYFNNNTNNALIIKAHPSEEFFNVPKKFRVSSVINKISLSSNIFFLDELSNIKPFDLYSITDIGLINISTVAIEMALNNKVVLTSGADGQYSNKGFTIDPKTKDEYFLILSELLNSKNNFKPDINNAEKYLFFRFFREALNFDLFQYNNMYSIKKINYIDDEQFFNDPSMKVIVDGILKDDSFILKTDNIKF